MKILIITGGNSSERKISLISAGEVKKALKHNGHRVAVFDFRKGYGELKKLLPKFDLVFPVMHGKEGEDGTLYQFLKSAKKRYVGSDPGGAKIAFDKILFKTYCDKNRIPTAPWKVVRKTEDIVKFGFPCVLKAAAGGSSREVVILNSQKNLSTRKVKNLLKTNHSLFVERSLRGVEITLGILLGKSLPVMEIVPPSGSWFDYQNKYSGKTRDIPFAPSINKKIQQFAQKIAVEVHDKLKLGSYSRMDFIVQDNIPYVLEVNTPGGVGLTPVSLLPAAAKAAGITFEVLVEKMLA